MDNHKVLCGSIIFLQIAFLPRGSTYNFSLCKHEEIQEDLLNVWDPEKTFTEEELNLDFHTCEDAPSQPTGTQQSEDSRRAERAGRLLECLLERARGCGERPELWRDTQSVLRRRCPGYCPTREGAGPARWGGPDAESPGGSTGSSGGAGEDGAGRREGAGVAAAGTVSPAPCDKSKARELMAVWRSYNNLG